MTTTNITTYDPDEGTRAVLARIDALRADPPPAQPTVEGITAALCSAWRIHAPADSDFPRRFGARVRAIGGTFSRIRGQVDCRFVYLPGTPEGRKIADEILALATADNGRRVTVVAEGSTAPFTIRRASVHAVRSMAEAEAGVRAAVTRELAERG